MYLGVIQMVVLHEFGTRLFVLNVVCVITCSLMIVVSWELGFPGAATSQLQVIPLLDRLSTSRLGTSNVPLFESPRRFWGLRPRYLLPKSFLPKLPLFNNVLYPYMVCYVYVWWFIAG